MLYSSNSIITYSTILGTFIFVSDYIIRLAQQTSKSAREYVVSRIIREKKIKLGVMSYDCFTSE